MLSDPFLHLAVALGLGLLVGLQRERAAARIAGIRTFALIALFGAVAAELGKTYGGWVVVAGLAVSGALVIAGHLLEMRQGAPDPGLTTEFAAVVMYGIGVLVATAPMALAVVATGAVALLLHLREPLHRFAGKLGEGDFTAIMQFVLIALVILPVLPDRAFGPYGVLNPYQVWWMVVLIVALSLAGYVAFKLFGSRAGAVLAGLLGGLVSSTATTVSYARRSVGAPELAGLATQVVAIASAVVYVRLAVEIAAVAPRSWLALAPPLLAMLGLCAALAAVAWWTGRRGSLPPPEPANPAELRSALAFGALYAVILLAVAFARDRYGAAGLYAVAGFSGLADLDALTLSTARLVGQGQLPAEVGWRAILLGTLANLAFKAGVVAVLGTWRFFVRIAGLSAVALAGGGLILWLWP